MAGALLSTPLWAAELHIDQLPNGVTQLSISGNGHWPETVRIEIDKPWSVQAATQPLPLDVEVQHQDDRRVIAQVLLKPGMQPSFKWSSRPGLATAQHQDSYPYLRPLPNMRAFVGGDSYGTAIPGQPVHAARDGIVENASNGYLLLVHKDGTLGVYSGFDVRPNLSPGDAIRRGDTIGQGNSSAVFWFRVQRISKLENLSQSINLTSIPSVRWDSAKYVEHKADSDRMARQRSETGSTEEAKSPAAPSDVLPSQTTDDGGRLERTLDAIKIDWLGDTLFIVMVLSATGILLLVFPLNRRLLSKNKDRTYENHSQVNVDAYARLLRAVGGDRAVADRLVNEEIGRGFYPYVAAQAALERIQWDRR